MSRPADQDPLTTLLRSGDPAAGAAGLEPAEREAMRRRVLAAAGERRRDPATWLLPAIAAATLLALALGLAWRPPRAAPTASAALPATSRTALAGAAAEPSQQIQFTTEHGTLVVWVLKPRATG